MRFTRFALITLAATLLLAAIGSVGFADEPPVAPVYLIISLDTEFEFDPGDPDAEIPPTYSQTILVNIGTMNPGTTVRGTRFLPPETAPTIPLPPETAVADLDGNACTIVGSFQTTGGDPETHVVTPVQSNPDAPIPPDVQAALFAASVAGDLDALADDGEGGPAFPTTHDIAAAVAAHLPEAGGEPTDEQIAEVAAHLFNTGEHLAVADNVAVDEGDMFPHDGTGVLFQYGFSFDDEGTFDSDVCLSVEVDVKPKSKKNKIKLNKKKDLKVAIHTTDDFDVSEIDTDTVEIGGVPAEEFEFKDVDGDGEDDYVGEWDIGDLMDAGVLTEDTSTLTVMADLTAGGCVKGLDYVVVKKKKGNNDDDDDDEDDDD